MLGKILANDNAKMRDSRRLSGFRNCCPPNPVSPWENGYYESFNSKLSDKFLNGEIFYSIKELRVLAECWRVHYNRIRPHSSLGYRGVADKPPTAAT